MPATRMSRAWMRPKNLGIPELPRASDAPTRLSGWCACWRRWSPVPPGAVPAARCGQASVAPISTSARSAGSASASACVRLTRVLSSFPPGSRRGTCCGIPGASTSSRASTVARGPDHAAAGPCAGAGRRGCGLFRRRARLRLAGCDDVARSSAGRCYSRMMTGRRSALLVAGLCAHCHPRPRGTVADRGPGRHGHARTPSIPRGSGCRSPSIS